MSKLILRTAMFGILLVSLAALSGAATAVTAATATPCPPTVTTIPKGDDLWVTPPNGLTVFTFPSGDVEALCGAAPDDAWNHEVALRGVAAPDGDYDTVVRRLNDATFSGDLAYTPIQVVHMAFASLNAQNTPCGPIRWDVGLAGPQRITQMTIRRTSAAGGIFNAEIAVDVEFRGFNALDGSYVGSLFYSFDLPDPGHPAGEGTPWSFNGRFRAGMTETENCIAVLRKKRSQYDVKSDHYYWISNLIAQGKCSERN